MPFDLRYVHQLGNELLALAACVVGASHDANPKLQRESIEVYTGADGRNPVDPLRTQHVGIKVRVAYAIFDLGRDSEKLLRSLRILLQMREVGDLDGRHALAPSRISDVVLDVRCRVIGLAEADVG